MPPRFERNGRRGEQRLSCRRVACKVLALSTQLDRNATIVRFEQRVFNHIAADGPSSRVTKFPNCRLPRTVTESETDAIIVAGCHGDRN